MTRALRNTLILAAVPLALALLAGAVIAVPAWILLLMGTTFDGPAASPPQARMNVTRDHGRATEIHATLAAGYRLDDCVNLSIFDGFEPGMAPEAALPRLGPPSGRWKVPPPKAPRFEGVFGSTPVDALSPYYDRAEGRVTLRPFPTPEQGMNWVPVAFPNHCSLEDLFTDSRLRAQVSGVLPAEGSAHLNMHSSDGWGALMVSLDRSGCQDLELLRRKPR